MSKLEQVMLTKAQKLRDMAADNLRGHRKFRGCTTQQGREMAEWYEGRYMAYKRAAEMIRDGVEECA